MGRYYQEKDNRPPPPHHRKKHHWRPFKLRKNPVFHAFPPLRHPEMVAYRTLNPSHHMYQMIQSLLTTDEIVIDRIVEVDNPSLKRFYRIKEAEKMAQYGHVDEYLLFHGTKRDNLSSICTHNFDWRLYGTNRGHKYGQGVSFSRNANYASNYSDCNEYLKVMIVAKVLVSNVCQGYQDMAYPPPGFDTAQKGDGIVIVKFDDHEFYPAYELFYHFKSENERDYMNQYNNSYHYYRDYYHNHYHYSFHF